MSEHRSSISEPKILHSNHQTSSRNRYSHHQWRFVSKHRELFGYIISTRHYPPYILCILRTVESNCRHGGVRVGVWTNRRCNGIFYTGLILITHSVALTISSTLKLEKSYLFYYFYSIIKKIQLLIKKWPSPIFYNISMLLFNQCRKAKMFCGSSTIYMITKMRVLKALLSKIWSEAFKRIKVPYRDSNRVIERNEDEVRQVR